MYISINEFKKKNQPLGIHILDIRCRLSPRKETVVLNYLCCHLALDFFFLLRYSLWEMSKNIQNKYIVICTESLFICFHMFPSSWDITWDSRKEIWKSTLWAPWDFSRVTFCSEFFFLVLKRDFVLIKARDQLKL